MHIESLREYCLSFPGATEAIKWEHHLNFYVGGKIFCISTLDAEGRVCFKVANENFDSVCEHPGIVAAPYMAHNKWVFVEHYDSLTDEEWQSFIAESYRIIRGKLPKKTQAALGEMPGM
jgi:predicted DNA-binding protein (MmcQ/YjbR family)